MGSCCHRPPARRRFGRSVDARIQAFNEAAVRAGTAIVLVLAIWALTGRGYFWPGWVILGLTVAVARRARDTWRGLGDEDDLPAA